MASAGKVCSQCLETLDRSNFSGIQWGKNSKVRKCSSCILSKSLGDIADAAALETGSLSSKKQKKKTAMKQCQIKRLTQTRKLMTRTLRARNQKIRVKQKRISLKKRTLRLMTRIKSREGKGAGTGWIIGR